MGLSVTSRGVVGCIKTLIRRSSGVKRSWPFRPRRPVAGKFLGRVVVEGNLECGDVAGGNLGCDNLTVDGRLTKAAGSFKIDHPLDPANKYLLHSFVESPDMMNIYNGEVALDGLGKATVELPAWFEALNQDFRYQLTAIGSPRLTSTSPKRFEITASASQAAPMAR